MDNQKVVLITGCSSGFGLLAAARLASRGHLVWATMRDLSKSQELENALMGRHAQAAVRRLDVTDPSSIKAVVDEIKQKHFHIDVLVNNAGFGMVGFFEDLSEEDIRKQMETNFFGVQNVCRAVLPLMRPRRQGKIINISSIAGLIASPCLGAYNASKWALEGFSESLYFELALFGIAVSLIEPGSYPTKIFDRPAYYARNFDNPSSSYYPFSQNIKAFVQKHLRHMNRDPEDIAALIERIINDPRPRMRYISDPSSWWRVAAQKILPPSLIAYFFRRIAHGNK